MSMKVSKLTTYWSADQAYDMLSLLDELRDVLWETYGDEIIEREIALAQQPSHDEVYDDFDSDDIPF